MSVSRYSSLSVIVLSVVTAAPALGLANRVFMSTNGNDSNNCANPNTPCLTFAGSMAQVAEGGEVIAEATGGYGAISVTKSVTISGPPGVVIYSGLSVTVNAPGATVVLRGLTIDGMGVTTGDGINAVAVAALHVESCVITGFAGTVSGGNGINFTSTGQLFVKDTIIRRNGQIAIWVQPSSLLAQASVDRCRLEQNGGGLWSGGLGGGVALTAIKDSVVSGNNESGLLSWAGSELNAEGCLVANNNFGVNTGYGGVIRLSNCMVTGNVTGLYRGPGSLLSRSNNTVEGNGTEGSFSGTYSAK